MTDVAISSRPGRLFRVLRCLKHRLLGVPDDNTLARLARVEVQMHDAAGKLGTVSTRMDEIIRTLQKRP